MLTLHVAVMLIALLDGLSAESTDESHRNRNKGRKVPLEWLVDVVPVPSDIVPRVV